MLVHRLHLTESALVQVGKNVEKFKDCSAGPSSMTLTMLGTRPRRSSFHDPWVDPALDVRAGLSWDLEGVLASAAVFL